MEITAAYRLAEMPEEEVNLLVGTNISSLLDDDGSCVLNECVWNIVVKLDDVSRKKLGARYTLVELHEDGAVSAESPEVPTVLVCGQGNLDLQGIWFEGQPELQQIELPLKEWVIAHSQNLNLGELISFCQTLDPKATTGED